LADDKDPPIEPQNFLGGVRVVNIGDVRVARGLSRRHHSSCPHVHMIYDNAERRIWCSDCERDVDGFDAFTLLVQGYHQALAAVERREEAIGQVEQFKLRSIAAKKLDEAWRHRNMVPCCPHCRNGLLPEDFKKNIPMLGKDYVEARKRGEV
jgi:hypothetical protein